MTNIPQPISPLTLNRLSVYLRALAVLEREGIESVSSADLARRFDFNSAQIRKDLAHFGEFGVRGVGYDVAGLRQALHELLGLDRQRRLIIVGAGNLGTALGSYVAFNDTSFRVVAAVDSDERRVGQEIGEVTVESDRRLAAVLKRSRADVAILTVPSDAALGAYERLVDAGIRTILNFAPLPLPPANGVFVKNVDLRIELEEISHFLSREEG